MIDRLKGLLTECPWVISFIRFLIASDIVLVILYIYKRMARTDLKETVVRYVDGYIQVSADRFNWKDKKEKLTSWGADYYHPSLVTPQGYIMMKAGCVLILLFIILLVDKRFFPLCFIGYFLPERYFKGKDKSDNKKMVQDVASISTALSIQVQGGEYLGVALAECADMVHLPRLKDALEIFGRHMRCGDITLIENLRLLSSKFTSNEILSLCTVMIQGLETGQTAECTKDLHKQCLANRDLVFSSKRARLDRMVTIATLIIFMVGIGFIVWRFTTGLTLDF